MDENLIDPSIYNESVEVESYTRNSSSRIERILSDGIPIFAEEIGCFSSNAEKYFISTSNKELEEKLQKDDRLLNNSEWCTIESSICNVNKNLEVLSNVIFCIQKAYCDNIQYINISQSYKIINEETRSIFSNEASKKELLLSISRRKSTLRPLVNEINLERNIIPTRFLTHYEILNSINELLPIWNISLYQNFSHETPIHECYNSLSLQVKLILPPLNLSTQRGEKSSAKLWTKMANICFEDLVLILSFQNLTDESDFHSFTHEKYVKNCVCIKVPETLFSFLDENSELNITFDSAFLFYLLNKTSILSENFVIPPSIKSKLSKQIHSSLRRIHWSLIDRAIFHTLIQELITIQKESKNHININGLDSNELSFSIDPQMIINHCNETREKFVNIYITFKQVEGSNSYFNSKENESIATILLREAFLEIWDKSNELDFTKLSNEFEECFTSNVNSSILLDTWIFKLQKYANLAHVPLLTE
ncbi:hypothetical protein FG386_003539 [Cryptosporidium ryanae]|uniref:uncharacterized protein n=1 Tax=Cryptosporidium ryanae TaxID=515981 RepID=UPI00351A5146|nr:hypothetical protein FG386_003539 [Cryptosporidium ryanae]